MEYVNLRMWTIGGLVLAATIMICVSNRVSSQPTPSASGEFPAKPSGGLIAQFNELNDQVGKLKARIDKLEKRSDQFVTNVALSDVSNRMLQYSVNGLGLATSTPDLVPEDQRGRWFIPTTMQERRVRVYPGKKVVAAWVTAPHHHHQQNRYIYLIPEIRNENEVWLKAAAANNDPSLMSISVHVLYHDVATPSS